MAALAGQIARCICDDIRPKVHLLSALLLHDTDRKSGYRHFDMRVIDTSMFPRSSTSGPLQLCSAFRWWR